MASREEQIRLHHQKWKKWKMENKAYDQKLKKQNEKPQESAHNFAVKIIGQLQQPSQQKSNSLATFERQFERQFQSNACSVCYEIMIPPRNPITLYPCGHSMCKACLFVNGHLKQKNYQLKAKNCSLCGENINNYAQNRNLMNLICTYTDNKHLIQKEEQIIQDNQQANTNVQIVDRLRLRCDILQKQKRSVVNTLAKQKKNKQVLSEVMQKLNEQKTKSNKQLSTLQEQLKLIQQFLKQKRAELDKTKSKIISIQQKKRVVQKTLEPIRLQKQKLQVLEAAKLLDHDKY